MTDDSRRVLAEKHRRKSEGGGGVKGTYPIASKSETGIINDPRDKTEEFANYFEDTFLPNKPASNDLEKFANAINGLAPEELLDIIKTLKNRKAPGRDGITNAAIKHLHLGAIDALRDIINGVLRYQHFPQTWKHATVIVLHKTGKPKDSTGGYRPISLLPGLSKVLEKVIERRLLEVVSEKEILPGFQFGFRQKHSTIHQLLRITEHVAEHLDRSTPTAAVMLDIEKAFDKVWHEGLVYKLRQYKFPAALTNLAQHYLKERTFAIISNQESNNIYWADRQFLYPPPKLNNFLASDASAGDSQEDTDDLTEPINPQSDTNILHKTDF
ncbi:hypothetical protein Trydic_g3832 [Trypoxylus dichotomus]